MNTPPAPALSARRARDLAHIARQQGQDIAHVRLLGIEAFQVMTDSVHRYLATFETTSPNLYRTLSLQIHAACQMTSAHDPTATRRQLIARAACLEQCAEAQDEGLRNGLDQEQIKALRQKAIADTAWKPSDARPGVGGRRAMSATVIQMPSRRVPRQLGPVPAILTGSQVLSAPSGPLLELRLIVPLAAVPADQRRPLAGLLRSGDPLTLTLATARGVEGG